MADEQQHAEVTVPSARAQAENKQSIGKKIPPGFLREADGKPSVMRLMSVIALFASIWFGWITLNSNAESQNGVYITTAFLIAAFAPKALQKFIENYYPTDKTSKPGPTA